MVQSAMGDTPADASADSNARIVTARESAAIAIAAVGEVVLLILALGTPVPAMLLLAGHVGVVLACGWVLFARRAAGSDLAFAYLILLLVAIAGPAGLLPLMASLPFTRMRDDGDAVAAWYDRLARAGKPSTITQTYDRIASGRVHLLDSAPPRNFLDVIKSGGMEERQRALGLIARHFHPDYTPVLEAALRSPEPVVRVQAAAVVARVREDLKARVALLSLDEPCSAAQALHRAGELAALQKCALVAEPLRVRCAQVAERLINTAVPPGANMVASVPEGRDARAALEDHLIAARRFKDLRVLRRVASATDGTRRKVRYRRSGSDEAVA